MSGRAWPFGDMPAFGFDLIMADPPWLWQAYSEKGEEKSPEAQYPTMSIAEIGALPVGELASRDCILFLWTTWPVLLDSGDRKAGRYGDAGVSPPGRVMASWGFRYVTGGAWLKTTVTGKTAFGTGYAVRSSCEPFLLGVMGSPDAPGASRARNVIEGLAREHSRKPDEAYAWCEAYMPAARRADIFSRQIRPGWRAWGNEIHKFEPGQ